MIDIQRDSARHGFEITIGNRLWFISDKKISERKTLSALFQILNFLGRTKSKAWIFLHRKEIEKNKERFAEINRRHNA